MNWYHLPVHVYCTSLVTRKFLQPIFLGGGGRDNMKYRSTGIKSTTIVCMCLKWGEVGELIVYLIYPQHNDSFLASFLHWRFSAWATMGPFLPHYPRLSPVVWSLLRSRCGSITWNQITILILYQEKFNVYLTWLEKYL